MGKRIRLKDLKVYINSRNGQSLVLLPKRKLKELEIPREVDISW